MKGTFLFLGTGASTGVPMVGCSCSVCTSSFKKNHRLRSSGFLEIGNRSFLIDVGPDFRKQFLTYNLSQMDGVIMTHAHYDHSGGLDDLRTLPYLRKKPIPFLLSLETLEELYLRFSYLFSTKKKSPFFQFSLLENAIGEKTFLDYSFQYMSYFQAKTKVTGFRVGSFAYITDIRKYSLDILEKLQGVKTLVISSLRAKTSPVHFSIQEAINFGESIQAEKIYLTHLAHEVDHKKVESSLPDRVFLAFDGLKITFE
ncbi:MAG: MBL fold metallo-hydrolase [Chlamydiota bacterium]